MFWDKIKDSLNKNQEKSKDSSNASSAEEKKPFDDNCTSDVDEELFEFRLNVAREKLEQKGLPKEEIEALFAKIRKDKSGESLKSLLLELDD